MNLALFDLDHTLLPLDSDHEWGEFLARIGAVDAESFRRANDEWFAHYQNGTLDPYKYLEFAFGILSGFPRTKLDEMHRQFMAEVVQPAILPQAVALVKKHLDAGDLVAIVTATNHFVTKPIAELFGQVHLIAAMPELDGAGNITGKLVGTPTFGPGKIVHTEAWLAQLGHDLSKFERSWFYSDSQNDIPLLERVTDPIATNPNAKLLAHAQARGWSVLNLFDGHAQ